MKTLYIRLDALWITFQLKWWLVKIKIHESPRLMVFVTYAWVIFLWLAVMIFLILAIANS